MYLAYEYDTQVFLPALEKAIAGVEAVMNACQPLTSGEFMASFGLDQMPDETKPSLRPTLEEFQFLVNVRFELTAFHGRLISLLKALRSEKGFSIFDVKAFLNSEHFGPRNPVLHNESFLMIPGFTSIREETREYYAKLRGTLIEYQNVLHAYAMETYEVILRIPILEVTE